MGLLESLVSLAQQYVPHVAASGLSNRIFEIAVLGPSEPSVVDLTEITELRSAPVDLSFVAKNVRFATPDVADAAIIGGMPVANVGDVGALGTAGFTALVDSLSEGDLSPPGVPGIAGALVGTIPIPIKTLQETTLPAGAAVRFRITDDSGDVVDDANWMVNSERRSGGTLTLNVAELRSLLLMPPIPFVELTADEPPIVRYRLQVSIRAWVASASTPWINVPPDPIDVPMPAIPVPTIAVFCSQSKFGGRKLIVVPGESPLETPEAVTQAIEVLSSALGDVSGLVGFLGLFLDSVATIQRALEPASDQIASGGTFFWKADQIADLREIHLVERGDFDTRGDFLASDNFDSMLLIGPRGRRIQCFNAPSFSSHEGQMDVSVGRELIALVPSLASRSPASTPRGRVSIVVPPSTQRGERDGGVHAIVMFANELTSLRFP